jgi:hypothetical protein
MNWSRKRSQLIGRTSGPDFSTFRSQKRRSRREKQENVSCCWEKAVALAKRRASLCVLARLLEILDHIIGELRLERLGERPVEFEPPPVGADVITGACFRSDKFACDLGRWRFKN